MGVARDLVEELKASFERKMCGVWLIARNYVGWLVWKMNGNELTERTSRQFCTRQLTNLVLKFKEW
ncbi:hypothetical protein DW954_02360 [Clostridium sp. AM45-5]|nr:hypothetical protein [Clostridium sp. AM45-5]RHS68200.1 hypothetical protein DW954_02360 [Clostridium sp. AM45-5]